MKLSISFLKSKYSLSETIDMINSLNYDGYLHVDICDGVYVDALKTDFNLYKDILGNATKPLDIHLMVEHPITYIKELLFLKPDIISVHISCQDNLDEIYNLLKEHNIKMGLVINPNEDIELVKNYFSKADLILIMSVNPGLGGQSFIDSIPFKLEYLNKIKRDNNYDFIIEVDGGINDITLPFVIDYIDVFVSGSFICMSDDYQKQVDKLLR